MGRLRAPERRGGRRLRRIVVGAAAAGVLAGAVPPALAATPAPAPPPPAAHTAPQAPAATPLPDPPPASPTPSPSATAPATSGPASATPQAGAVPAPPAANPAPQAPPALPFDELPPSPSTSATPNPQPGPSPDPKGGAGVSLIPGFLRGLTDIPGKVADAINSWLRKLAESALAPMMDMLGATVLSTPDVTAGATISEIWWDSVAIADSLMLLVLTAGALLVMGHETLQTRTTAKELAPRMVVGMVLAHLSLPLLGMAIRLANGISGAVVQGRITAQGIGSTLTTTLVLSEAGPFVALVLLAVAALAVALVVGWGVRLLVLMLLAVSGPLLLIGYGLPQTAGLAKLWGRALAGCLAVQVAHALLLLIGLRVLLSDEGHALLPNRGSLLNILLCAALFVLALRLEGWVTRMVLRSTGGPSTVVTLVKVRMLRRGLQAAGIRV
ncbi:hypothetical protein E0F15_11210 [Frankia sp. B2]|uniref:hypothetical protein n=1 Tax=Frankia sp. B2 TaxID=2541730 RepID=UPI00106B815D|nr:hypothetical protein [Frankia sp. B2]TFE31041.1 hypothetical protein E0F15_11210 [Frankia sp. B2]